MRIVPTILLTLLWCAALPTVASAQLLSPFSIHVSQTDNSNLVFVVRNDSGTSIRLPTGSYAIRSEFFSTEMHIGLWLTHDWRYMGSNWVASSHEEKLARLAPTEIRPGESIQITRPLSKDEQKHLLSDTAATKFTFSVPEEFARGFGLTSGYAETTNLIKFQPGKSDDRQNETENNKTVVIEEEGLCFRRISPRNAGTNSPDFFLLETEVTNDQYARFLHATGKTKGDAELAEALRKSNSRKRKSISSISPVYGVANSALLWKDNTPPSGLGDHPVVLITIGDAKAYCEWLSSRYPNTGRFRLPTVSEWLFAAYGTNRDYPWGNEWSFDIPCVSSSKEKRRTTTEPVKAHAQDKTPEGIYGMWGNAAEYVTDEKHFRNDTRWMGPSFKQYPGEGRFPFTPRNGWWGYVHNAKSRMESLGFRVLLEIPDGQRKSGQNSIHPNAKLQQHIAAHAQRIKAEEYEAARKLAMGDLDGDGVEDTAVVYTLEGADRSNSHEQFLAVSSSRDGGGFVTVTVGGKGVRAVDAVRIVEAGVELGLLEYAPSDALCCPTRPATARYVLRGEKLVEH